MIESPPNSDRVPLPYRSQLERERQISHTLQHAIQPATGVVRDIDGLRVAVRPARPSTQVRQ